MNHYTKEDIKALNLAIKMSETPLKQKKGTPVGGPFGAVIYKDGKCIAKGNNHVLKNNDPTSHAEVYTIRKACKKLKTHDLSGCVLYSSCEPCPMCLMAAKWANIEKIYFGATRKDAANVGFRDDELYNLLKPGIYATPIPECQKEAADVMKRWFVEFSKTGQY